MKKCIKCLKDGNNYTLYSIYKNRNFFYECFDEDSCKLRKQKLKKEDYEEFFKEKFGCNFNNIQPFLEKENDYFFDPVENKYFVHYNYYNDEQNIPLKDKLKITIYSFLSYPISLIDKKDVPELIYD